MKRSRRRLWTFTVTIVASLVVLAALATGLFRLAVQLAPEYRDELEAAVSEAAGAPVRIGGMDLTWRGLQPGLDLSEVRIEREARPVLQLSRLRFGFPLWRLLQGDLSPTRLQIYGLSLAAERHADGRITIDGLDLQADADARDNSALEILNRFAQISFEDCELTVRAAELGQGEHLFRVERLDALRSDDGFSVEALLRPPDDFADRVQASAHIIGAPAQPGDWRGEWRIELDSLAAGPWLQRLLSDDAAVRLDAARLIADGNLVQGQPARVALQVQLGSLSLSDGSSERLWRDLSLTAHANRDRDAWTGVVEHFAVDGPQGNWPASSARLAYRPLAGEGRYTLDIDASLLRLDDLAPWLLALRERPAALAEVESAQGSLYNLVLRLRQEADGFHLAYRATLESLGARTETLALGGLGGEVSGDERGGQLTLAPGALVLALPEKLPAPARFDSLAAELHWTREPEAWHVSAPRFDWALLGTTGSGSLDLRLPSDADAAPQMTLKAEFAADDVTALKGMMPLHWGQHLKDWLRRGIDRGRLASGRLLIAGPMDQFPFRDGGGQFEIDLDLRDARLIYGREWPAIDDMAARLAFRGDGLTINSDRGRSLGLRIDSVHATIPDFRKSELAIDGRITGDLKRYYRFIQDSPLAERLGGLLRHTQASGDAALDLHLDIPLRAVAETRVSGLVTLDQATVNVVALNTPVQALSGALRFADSGVSADALVGEFAGQPLRASISESGGGGLLQTRLRLAPGADDAVTTPYVPQWIRRHLTGSSDWDLAVQLGGHLPFSVDLRSDLKGTAIDLPAPLQKSDEDAVPIRVQVRAQADDDAARSEPAAMRVDIEQQDRLHAQIALAPDADGELRSRDTRIRLGTGELPPPGLGIAIGGHVRALDPVRWRSALFGPGLAAPGDGADNPAQTLRQLELQIDTLRHSGYQLREVVLGFQPQADGWTARLTGGAQGEIRWFDAGAGAIRAHFDHARIETGEDAEHVADVVAAEPATTDPAQIPTLDLDVRLLTFNDVAIDQVEVLTTRLNDGLRLERAAAGGGALQGEAHGLWQRRAGRSSASIDFDFSSSQSEPMLKALGYAANVSARNAKFSGALHWSPEADGVTLAQADGSIDLELREGNLRAVEPGAGRVLGLINIFALPRRLALNFKDVVGGGLSFDELSGHFELADGNAHTDNLVLKSPSLKMELSGRIGLQDRDFDQEVHIYPDVSSGVTLGAALLGGPAAGLIALIAQEILEKPLGEVTQLNYHVTGSWDNPKVSRGEREG